MDKPTDTPRVDGQKEYRAFEVDADGVLLRLVRKDFAQSLERELAALREQALVLAEAWDCVIESNAGAKLAAEADAAAEAILKGRG